MTTEAPAHWAHDSLEITDAFGRVVPISLRYNTGFLDAAVRANVRDCVTFFWRFEEDALMGAGGPSPELEAGLAEMETALISAIPGDGGSLVAVRLGNGMVEYAVAFFSEAAHESFAEAFEPPEAFFNKFAAQQFAHGHEFWPEYLPQGFEAKG
ncbi:MAG: hypothetical protein ACPG42_01845 [Alphaproteobacteria bacterium]